MDRLRQKLSNLVPKAMVPFARRQVRVFDQIRNYRASQNRPGVVLMLHVGRCGSTVLANLLEQNPRIHWDGKLPRKAKQLYGDRAKRLDVGRWTKRQFAISGDRFYGFEFKILADQYPAMLGTSTPEFLRTCKEIGVTHYVLLVRRNTLRHVVSHYASLARGKWHTSSSAAVSKKKFQLDIENITTGSAPGRSLISYLQEVEDAHEMVRRELEDQQLLEIEYETDIDENGAEHAYQRVCEFLGLPSEAVNVRNVKINPYPIESIVVNYAEIEQALSNTNFAWMTQQ